MSLKSRFFKKPWEQKNDEKRLDAVREEHDPELISALPELAQHDPSAKVRLAALRRINTEPFWLDARLRETEPDILEAADRFLLRAVSGSSAPELEAERLRWFERVDSTDTIRTLAGKAKEIPLRKAALERIHSQGFLGDCYFSEADPGLASDLLERIDQISTLERLHQKLKKSNKSKTRAVLARLQAVQASQGDFDANQVSAERLVSQAEALARGENLEQRDSILAELRKDWNGLENAPDRLKARFQGALSIVEAAMARPAVDKEAAEQAEKEAAASEARSPMESVADSIREQIRKNKRDLRPQKLLAEWDRAWNTLKQVQEADLAIKNEMLPILKELQTQVQRQTPSEPSEAENSGADAQAAEKLTREAFKVDLDELSGLLESGDIAQANALRNRIRGQLHSLPAKQRPGAVSGRLQRLEGRLKEMRDYQHWSHNNHRDELIERIEALPESGQHPDAISAALKEARAEWQRLEKLEVLPGDKRKFAAPGGQWRRFQDACSAAFDSAKPYFEKRQSVQEETLDQLEAFVGSGLEQAEDESAGPKELMPLLRKSRQAIRRLDDLPPKSRGAAAGKLRGLMNAISKRLETAFEQVEMKKRRLISEAEGLSQEGELKTAIDRAKGLQADWKRAGQGRRKIDQKLWKEFRAAIDPLFEQLDGQRRERQQENQETIKQIEQLCEQAEALIELPDAELVDASGQMQGLADTVESLHPKPPALIKRFDRARRAFSDRQFEIRKAQEQQAAQDLVDCVRTIQDAFYNRLKGQAVEHDRLKEVQDSLPRGIGEAMEIVSDESLTTDQLASKAEANLDSALQIAVEFEFTSGLDSPPEEKARRMDYQVQRLAARMSEGSSQQDLGTELASLEDRWYRSLPLPESDFEAIRARIEKCQSTIRKMMGIA